MGALVLALNPSIDAEWRVDQVQWEEKNTIRAERRWAGGKGVNVARWLQVMRGSPQLLLPLGGSTGAELARHLRREQLPAAIIRLRGTSRVNVIVTTAEGRQLRFNPPGPVLSRAEWLAVLEQTRCRLPRVSCVVISGSLPRGVPADAYGQIIRRVQRGGVKAVLDCDGESFRRAVPARPFLVKPNEHELAQWSGRSLGSGDALMNAARALSAATRGWVLVSRGRHGGLLVNSREGLEFFARPPRIETVNTVGAGDAMVAAIARQLQLDALPREWLRWGVAAGAAATQCAAGALPKPSMIKKLARQVTVT